MHELGIIQQVIEMACERAAGARIRKIVLEVGELTAVLPDALHFCFELAAAQTAAEGASLEIIPVPGSARCSACGGLVALHRPFGRCTCGGTDLEWLSGEELKIKSLEVL